ncbi:MAG TPA: hypothetical protein PKK10_10460 [Woeseiaceae bacterium]|nr:hypothetical protein [Woeseiaceae bacterium]
MKAIVTTLVATLAMAGAGMADAQELVKEFNGERSTVTEAFTVEAPWLLDWRLNTDYEQSVALDIELVDATTGHHKGRVLYTKQRGNGLKLFETGGTYKLRISSALARWTVKILQVAPEDAERYAPRKENTPKPYEL